MRYTKTILVALISLLTLQSFAQDVEAKLEFQNTSDDINDGQIKVVVSKGVKPYRFEWSNNATSLYSSVAKGLTEGQEYTVTIVDANGSKKKLKGTIAPESMAEKMNSSMKPVVGVMSSVIFWDPFANAGIADPTIYIDETTVTTPLLEDEEYKYLIVEEIVAPEGSEVNDGDVILKATSNMGIVHVYSPGDGIVTPKVKVGDTLKSTDENGELIVSGVDIAHLKYSTPQPLKNPNGSPSSTGGIPLVVVWLVLGAIFFTVRMRFINIRGAKHAIELVQGKFDDPDDHGEVSHFQALTTALSGTVGLGNIASVAIAISIGGAGATFWMILAGLIGMSSKFVECTLGVKYREIDEHGEVHGGPMYYLNKGLAKKNMKGLGRILAGVFAVLCIGGSFGGGNMFQANQAYAQFDGAVGGWDGGGPIFGIILAILVGIVIIGGIRSIAKVTDKIVPLMVSVYVLVALIIIFANISELGSAFSQIFNGAFHADAVKGGFLGVLIIGFQRAAFSNEAGVGSASIAHSAARTKEPVSEGIVALLEPFIDTVVVCTMTALVLIFTGYAADPQGLTGAELTSAAFSREFAWFQYVLTLAIILFAFSTMISWSYYGLKAWTYLFGRNKAMDTTYKILFLLFVVIGSSVGLGSVLDFSDMMVLGMAFPNILGLVLMSGEVKEDMMDYFARIKSGAIKKFK